VREAHSVAIHPLEGGEHITLAQLPGTSTELGSSRRDQRRRSSALSAASSASRRYRALEDDIGGL
jgi:hypothetical protein